MQVIDAGDPANTSPPADQQMTTISRHYFGSPGESPDAFSITVIESMKEEYGLFVWPCSVVLAEYVWQERLRFTGVSVVELGAGTSLPGLVAAKVGSDVTLTDDSNRPEAGVIIARLSNRIISFIAPFITIILVTLEVLANMKRVSELNNLDCKVMGLTWGVWDETIFSLSPKLILGADVLYDASAFDDLFATVAFLLQTSPDTVFITTYHNRSGHHLIEFLMEKWGLECVSLLDGFSFMPSGKASGLSGNIQLAEIVLNSK